MRRRKLRIGVAGLGRIGWKYHCREIAKQPAFELAATQDVEADRCREAERVYGVPSFTTFAGMLEGVKLDAVAIATPSHLHKEMAVQALRAGCHVLLDKPMAANAREAAVVLRAATRYGRIVTVYQPLRAAAYFQHLRRILESGAIGEVYHVRVGAYRYVRRDDWQSLLRYGGGMLNNAGSHVCDQVLQLIGYDVKRVFCNRRVVASLGDAEDVAKIVVETRKGLIGEVDINQASAINPYSLQVWGTAGAVSYDPDRARLTVKRLDIKSLPPKKLNRSLASADRLYPSDPVKFHEEKVPVDRTLEVDVYADFAAAIRKEKAPFVRPEEPLAVMRLLDRCREDSGRILKTRGAASRR